ncbi:MAG: nucleotidyltransferase domain-containing protein, partial [Deltaproteobacteria bacterium]
MTLSEADIRYYRFEAVIRQKKELQELEERYALAWNLARQAAKLLKEEFGATRVVAFGSLLLRETFTPWSDVDIAAWGIPPLDTFRAIGEVMDLSTEIDISLVDMATCKEPLKS